MKGLLVTWRCWWKHDDGIIATYVTTFKVRCRRCGRETIKGF